MSVVLAPPDDLVVCEPHDAAAFAAASGASANQIDMLAAFRDVLADWNTRMNLVGPSALDAFWSRHAWDSAQLLQHAPGAKTWADLGAGAGFPGLVLAILLKGQDGAHVHLVESMTKRCRFLTEVVQRFDLPATVHNDRAENCKIDVDAVTARACAPVVRLLGYAQPYLKRGAVGLFLKGQDVEVELTEATKYWKFSHGLRPSLSSETGRILVIEGVPRER